MGARRARIYVMASFVAWAGSVSALVYTYRLGFAWKIFFLAMSEVRHVSPGYRDLS